MVEMERPDQEPIDQPATTVAAVPKGRRSLLKVRRELSEEELSSPAVQRLLIDEIERLERENRELVDYRDKFYEEEKKVAILTEKSKKSVSSEIIYSACLTIGAAALGYAPAAWSMQPTGYLSIVFGAVLILLGVGARFVYSGTSFLGH